MIRGGAMTGYGKQKGVTLLEIMVAALVFSVGVIGVASMMLTGMRSNDTTLMRTHSTILANEIYENILANMPAAENGDYDLSLFSAMPTSTALDCHSNACTTAELADWDLAQWGARVNRSMAWADAGVAVDTSVDPAAITVQLRFKPTAESPGFLTETFTFRARN